MVAATDVLPVATTLPSVVDEPSLSLPASSSDVEPDDEEPEEDEEVLGLGDDDEPESPHATKAAIANAIAAPKVMRVACN
jgi:hypothetical protein